VAISLGISKVGKNRDLKKIKLKNQIFDLIRFFLTYGFLIYAIDFFLYMLIRTCRVQLRCKNVIVSNSLLTDTEY